MVEVIHPRDEQHWLQLRALDITSTEIAALFGVSPYTTEFELWHRKHSGLAGEFEPNERITWGQRLQDAIAEGIAEDRYWSVRKMTEYVRDPEKRIGASFDYAIRDPLGILEIKNVDALVLREKWVIEGGDVVEAPLHIELQVQHQLLLSGREVAFIGALVGGNRVVLLERKADKAVHEAIVQKAARFWLSVEMGMAPSPDLERDSEFICRTLFAHAEPGKVYDASQDHEMIELATTYKHASTAEKNAKATKDAVKAMILMKMGDAERAVSGQFSVSAAMVGPATVTYEREPYRNFRVNWKKEK